MRGWNLSAPGWSGDDEPARREHVPAKRSGASPSHSSRAPIKFQPRIHGGGIADFLRRPQPLRNRGIPRPDTRIHIFWLTYSAHMTIHTRILLFLGEIRRTPPVGSTA